MWTHCSLVGLKSQLPLAVVGHGVARLGLVTASGALLAGGESRDVGLQSKENIQMSRMH